MNRLVNQVILEGRLAFDPVLNTSKNGERYTSFLVFNNHHTKSPTKENPFVPIKDNLAVPCVAWGKLAEILCEYGKKGLMISVIGCLKMYRYVNKEGLSVNKLYVQATNINFLSKEVW